MSNYKTDYFQVRLSPLLKEKIKKAADKQQETMTEYVRKSVERRMIEEGN